MLMKVVVIAASRQGRPTPPIERTDTALSCGAAAHQPERWPSSLSRGVTGS